MVPTSEEFQAALDDRIARAWRQGMAHLEVKAGDLHREVGDYPGRSHRMPTCCHVLRRRMRAGDEVVREPEKGTGASLMVRYRVAR
jgi:5-methylcytosine-specific restriction protein A